MVDAFTTTHDRLDYTQECLKLFDEAGAPKSSVSAETLDEAKQLKAAKAKFDELDWNDTTCIFRGFTMLNNDHAYYTDGLNELTEEMKDVEASRETNSADYLLLIKENSDYIAFKEMRNKWYSRLFRTTHTTCWCCCW